MSESNPYVKGDRVRRIVAESKAIGTVGMVAGRWADVDWDSGEKGAYTHTELRPSDPAAQIQDDLNATIKSLGGDADPINSPAHYTAYPVEVIELTECLNFNRGNAVKYIARAGLKSPDTEAQDLEKARWYIDREINRMKASS